MVQDKEKNNLLKRILGAVKPVDQTLNEFQNTATPVWTNLDKLIDLYMGEDFRAIAEDRIHYYSYEEGYSAGYYGDFGHQVFCEDGKIINEDAKEAAIQKEIEWLMDYEGKEKNQ